MNAVMDAVMSADWTQSESSRGQIVEYYYAVVGRRRMQMVFDRADRARTYYVRARGKWVAAAVAS